MKLKTFLLAAALLGAPAYTGKGQPVLQFSRNSYTVAESAGGVPLVVLRSGDTKTAVSVNFTTEDGTAANGLKYTLTSGKLAFDVGVTNQTIEVPILNDGLVQGSKYFRVILSNPTDGAVLGTATNVVVSITDNDFGIQFQFAATSVAEDAGQAMIGVVRGDDGNLPVTVDFFTTDLTAKSGLDYTSATSTLSFAPQERLKLVSIPILNNTLKQPNRTFRGAIVNPVGASLGSQRTTTVTIVDNDQGFQFESANYSVAEDAGVALITVLRGTDDTNSTVTVDYATSDLSATNRVDFLGLTNTLSFAPGEKVKLVGVPILDDGVKGATRSFRVTLNNPTSGAVLGSPPTATVKILDNDPGVGFELGSYSVWENAGFLNLTVLRGNDIALGPITVDYATSNLTAVAGQDYEAVSGTLAFGQNETITNISVPILCNGSISNNTRFTLTLSNPTGGATLGRASTIVNITNVAGLGTYRAVAPLFDTALTILHEQGFNVLTWSGGGQLQRADKPAGPWQTITNASSPYTVQSPIATTFYRVARPRPVNLYVPSRYDGQTPVPLVILLHGYSFSPAYYEGYMQLQPLAEARGFLYCDPESTSDQWGNEFWAGTDGCCDFGNTGVDDASYLRGLIEEIGGAFVVDPKRIYLIGHSNGGFMAYRMACQSADVIAGIASLAGMTFLDPSRCQPSQPVNILQIHGTADANVPYAGGANTTTSPVFSAPANLPAFPGALKTIEVWAWYNGASNAITGAGPSMDLDLAVQGLDTIVTRYTNYLPGGAVELWTINGGTHFPTLHNGNVSSEFAPRVIDWLLAHPKP